MCDCASTGGFRIEHSLLGWSSPANKTNKGVCMHSRDKGNEIVAFVEHVFVILDPRSIQNCCAGKGQIIKLEIHICIIFAKMIKPPPVELSWQ
jgi:hypothetical protein